MKFGAIRGVVRGVIILGVGFGRKKTVDLMSCGVVIFFYYYHFVLLKELIVWKKIVNDYCLDLVPLKTRWNF